MYNSYFLSNANARPLSAWHLHVTRKQLRSIRLHLLTLIRSHFCYVCGELIVKSALRSEIQAAVSQHYRSCRLFDDVLAPRRR